MSLDLAKTPQSGPPIHLLDDIQGDSSLPGPCAGLEASEGEMKTEDGKGPGGAMMLAIGAKFDSTLTQSREASWLDLPASIWHQQAVSQIMQSIQTACETVFPQCKGKLILSVRIEIGENWGKLWAALDLGKVPSEMFPSMQVIARAVSLEMYNPTDKKQAQTFGQSDPSLREQESEQGVSPQQPGGADSGGSDPTLPDHLLDVWNLVDAAEGDGQRAAVLEKVMREGRSLCRHMSKSTELKSLELVAGNTSLLQRQGMPEWKSPTLENDDLEPQPAQICGINHRRKRIDLALERSKGRVVQVLYVDQAMFEQIHDTYLYAHHVRRSNLTSDPAFDWNTGFPRVVVKLNKVEKNDAVTYRLLQIRSFGVQDIG